MTQPQRFRRGRGVAAVVTGSAKCTGAVAIGMGASGNVGVGQLGGQNFMRLGSGFGLTGLPSSFAYTAGLRTGVIVAPKAKVDVAIKMDILSMCVLQFVVVRRIGSFPPCHPF